MLLLHWVVMLRLASVEDLVHCFDFGRFASCQLTVYQAGDGGVLPPRASSTLNLLLLCIDILRPLPSQAWASAHAAASLALWQSALAAASRRVSDSSTTCVRTAQVQGQHILMYYPTSTGSTCWSSGALHRTLSHARHRPLGEAIRPAKSSDYAENTAQESARRWGPPWRQYMAEQAY